MSCIAVDIVVHELARAQQMATRLNNTQSILSRAREQHWWCHDFLGRLQHHGLSDEESSVTNTCRKCLYSITAHNINMSKCWLQLAAIRGRCKERQEANPSFSDHTPRQALDVEHDFTALETLIKELEDLDGKGLVIEVEVENHKALEEDIAMDQVKAFLSGLERVMEWEVEEEACCVICLRLYFESMAPGDEVVRLPCNIDHAFHSNCISHWFHRKNICPFDRSVVFLSIMDELR